MKHTFFRLLPAFFVLTLLAGCGGKGSQSKLETGFMTPPDSIQTSIYWYWLSGNIDKEGVVKDLQSMKEAGFDRAFIGHIGLSEQESPIGPVRMFTEEWYDILHTAFKTATELGIDLGMFNSPGWSQAGGPWIKPEQAMRYLASTRTEIKGGKPLSVALPKPEGPFQDVKVLAYPMQQTKTPKLNLQNAKIVSSDITGVQNLIDGNRKTALVFTGQKKISIEVTPDEDFTLRSVRIYTTPQWIDCKAELQVKTGEKGEYEVLRKFDINRTYASVDVGFDPYAPVVLTTPSVEGKAYRLVLSGLSSGSGIEEIEFSSIPLIERYPEKTLAKMHQTPLPYWKDYMWPEQPDPYDTSLAVSKESVLDITDKLQGDVLTWDAPEGNWVILRTGMLPTGAVNQPSLKEDGLGLEVDKWSPKHLAANFDAYIGDICRRIPYEDRKSWKVLVADSYERGGQNFGDDFFEYFTKHFGYDPTPFLPVYNGVVVESKDVSDRFLWDLRRMGADRLAYDHVGALRELAHQNGFTIWLENYGHWGFPGEFLQYGGQSDEVSGEFWSVGDLGDIENRAATSCAHIYGKNKVSAESFTFGGTPFSHYPATMKQRGDRFFSEGINNSLLHLFIHQPGDSKKPGRNAWFGNEFNRNNTWYSQIDLFVRYLKRVNFMLQQGLNVADVAYFIGEDAPKMTGITDPPLPQGYQFDYINAEVIERDMTVRNGLLTLPHGTQYKILVLPKQETMRPELLAKIKNLVNGGAVILGPAPKRSPSLQNYPQADKEVAAMAAELWGGQTGEKTEYRYGKGLVLNGYTMEEALAKINCVPDCKWTEDDPLLYGHRTAGGAEIYFLTNQSDKTVTVSPEFRITGLQPEWWTPTTGKTRKLPAYAQNKETTAVPLVLEPYESVFIVFRDKAGKAKFAGVADNFPQVSESMEIKTSWQVRFDKEMGGEEEIVLDALQDWSESDNEKIKYYSGTAFYTTIFDLPSLRRNETLYLNLNHVGVMAKVRLNGQYVDGVWTPPYKVDITPYVKKGSNRLEIEVVNTWRNRLIGDSRLPEAERVTWALHNPYNMDTPLAPSGLIGPVVVETVTYK